MAGKRRKNTSGIDPEYLKKQKEALHPVDIICRYNTSRGRKKEISGGLVGALEQIALEHVAHYDAERSGEKLEEAKYRLCKEILDSSKRVVGKEDIFSVWYEKFLQYKIVKAVK